MISGFTREALITLPNYEDYIERSTNYHNKVHISIKNICSYLDKCSIQPFMLTTDGVAQSILPSGVKWINPLNPGDTYFVKQNCNVPLSVFDNAKVYSEVLTKATEKFPNVRGLSTEARFELMLKRNTLASREIVTLQKLLIYFKHKGMKPRHKEASNRLHIEIDSVNFLVKCYMGATDINPIDILGFDSAQFPVYEWKLERV